MLCSLVRCAGTIRHAAAGAVQGLTAQSGGCLLALSGCRFALESRAWLDNQQGVRYASSQMQEVCVAMVATACAYEQGILCGVVTVSVVVRPSRSLVCPRAVLL